MKVINLGRNSKVKFTAGEYDEKRRRIRSDKDNGFLCFQ